MIPTCSLQRFQRYRNRWNMDPVKEDSNGHSAPESDNKTGIRDKYTLVLNQNPKYYTKKINQNNNNRT